MIAADELEQYDKWDVNLLTIPPGITGLWQVSGRSEVGYPERVQLDMRYIRNWSIFLDIQIILRTAVVVLNAAGGLLRVSRSVISIHAFAFGVAQCKEGGSIPC